MSNLPTPPPDGLAQSDDTSPLVASAPESPLETDEEKNARLRLCREVEAAVGRTMQTPRAFEFLSKRVFEKTHVHVSTSTLKRMWGYVASSSLPREATLDLLSQFVGYKDWSDFQTKAAKGELASREGLLPPRAEGVEGASAGRRKRKPTFVLLPAALVLAVALLLLYVRKASRDNAIDDASSVESPGHAYVDLGLPSGTHWATTNVGAAAPEEYGYFYAWGETETKGSCEWANYKWRDEERQMLTKYIMDTPLGFPDCIEILEPADDVAHVLWGGGWRTPTVDDWQELIQNSIWEWTTSKAVWGVKVTSVRNGAVIFLPAAGYRISNHQDLDVGEWGHYWTSSLSVDNNSCAWNACFSSEHFDCSCFRSFRCNGQSIRPVMNPPVRNPL